MDKILQTERLHIKIYTPQQFAEWFETKSQTEMMQLLHFKSEEDYFLSKEKTRRGYTTHRSTIRFFYFYRKDIMRFIGDVAFHNWFPEHRRSEIGYAIQHHEDREKGYMFEAVQCILNYGFQDMNLNRVEACIGPNNAASLALIRKLGFTQEGVLRQHYHVKGELQDSVLFSLLKQDWA